jgi:hypothetical protein
MKRLLLLLVIVVLIVPSAAMGAKKKKRIKYQVIEVTNGGVITGKVKAAKMVKDPVLKLHGKHMHEPDDEDAKLEMELCGSSQKADMYILSSKLEVRNAFVILEGIKEGAAPPKTELVLDNNLCKFVPLVGIAYVKGTYKIVNSDSIFHNTSIGLIMKNKRRTVYNLALPKKDQVITKSVRVAGLQNVKCDSHAWMRSYIYASRHPYVAITDVSGNFKIPNVPPGTYTLKFWHEGFEEVTQSIEVKAGSTTKANASFSKTVTPAFMKGL